jgi:hypothetical protein
MRLAKKTLSISIDKPVERLARSVAAAVDVAHVNDDTEEFHDDEEDPSRGSHRADRGHRTDGRRLFRG